MNEFPTASISARVKFLLAGLTAAGMSVALVWQSASGRGLFRNNADPQGPVLITALIGSAMLASAVIYLPGRRSGASAWWLVGWLALMAALFAGLACADFFLYFAFGGNLRM